MDFDPKSLREMTQRQMSKYWPNLYSNYRKTSEETIDYNCVAYVNEIEDDPIDFSTDEIGAPAKDKSSKPYIEYFKEHRFIECEDGTHEEGIQKIAIYEFPDGDFAHVAKQMANGTWRSKIGELEDIEHPLNALEYENYNGESYGIVKRFMKREILPDQNI
jgi:hypothetical protein